MCIRDRCVDAVEAATKRKFDDGMAFERDIFMNLMLTPESLSLIHISEPTRPY